MKNTYFTSYFPLLSIILFSLSLSIKVEKILLDFLKENGIYVGMLEFFSEGGIKLSLLVLLLLIFFMVFAALKLIANTINELSLLFFSKDAEGENLKQIRSGAAIYFIGSALSLISMNSFIGIGIIFVATTVVYFMYFVYKVSNSLSVMGLIGIIFFQVLIWSTLITGVIYLVIKVYNSIMASLPI
ncbi:YufK family protein [Bacillus sp. FJAT-49705]|uniref:YufK family protein n=1 Tax=Cytobacillus citreus TaxID=2833586 RepID=A0ABS5NUF1_9BACI|nr:YufK family protein [Cytobacillus citreus]MBS4190728.1 YufK family protein [Cytobacillus citreus]